MQVQHRTAPCWPSSVSPCTKQRRPEAARGSLSSPEEEAEEDGAKEDEAREARSGADLGGSLLKKEKEKDPSVLQK